MAQNTKVLLKGISLKKNSLFILKNTNRCIAFIINESLTNFWLMQKFEVTIIKKCMFCPILVFIRFGITCGYVHSIIDLSRNTGCYLGLSFYSRYWIHPNNISNTWGIFYSGNFCIFQSYRRELSVQFKYADVFSNPNGRIYNSIL